MWIWQTPPQEDELVPRHSEDDRLMAVCAGENANPAATSPMGPAVLRQSSRRPNTIGLAR